MSLAIILASLILIMILMQYRTKLVFKHRRNAIAVMNRLCSDTNRRTVAITFRYYDKYIFSHQLLALNKWKYDAFFPELENKLLRIRLKHR
jgi:hypothetical protein